MCGVQPTQLTEGLDAMLLGIQRNRPAARRVVARVAGDETEIELELDVEDVLEPAGLVWPIPTIFA